MKKVRSSVSNLIEKVGLILTTGFILLILEIITPGSVTGPMERFASGVYDFLDAVISILFFFMIMYILIGFFYWLYKKVKN